MAKVVVSMKLEPELAEWASEYAAERGVSRNALYESAVINLREDSKQGVPDLYEAIERQSYSRDKDGVGDCSKRDDGGTGHVWAGIKVDSSNPCKFCGYSGRQYFAEATQERHDLFKTLSPPKGTMTFGTGKAPGGGS